jgi:hypothetical protein
VTISGEGGTLLSTQSSGLLLRRITGTLFLIGALSFATAATILSATFDWPDILREPADVVLTRFAEGGPSLVWTWFATAWTYYAILIVPILLLPIALDRRDDAALWVASFAGAISAVLALIGALGIRGAPTGTDVSRGGCRKSNCAGRGMARPAPIRWRAAGGAPRTVARDRLVGHPQRHRVTQSSVATLARTAWTDRQRALPVQSGRHPGNGSPRFPVFDLAGLVGSTGWGLWIAALGVTLLFRPRAKNA